MKLLAILLSLSLTVSAGDLLTEEKPKEQKIEEKYCQSTKEYITVYRYLQDHQSFTLKKNDMMKISEVVSNGCNGAAKRFVDTIELLMKAGLEASDAIKLAMKFAEKSDQTTETFATIFKETFLKEYLDLDLKTAVDFSFKLAVLSDGNPTMIKNDFEKIVKFCLDSKGLDLSGPKCSDLASKVATTGAKFKQEISSVFFDHYNFLIEKESAGLPTGKAIEMSVKLINAGPISAVNFKDAYKFAISKTGLDLEKGKAISYAEQMAERSTLNLDKNLDKNLERITK